MDQWFPRSLRAWRPDTSCEPCSKTHVLLAGHAASFTENVEMPPVSANGHVYMQGRTKLGVLTRVNITVGIDLDVLSLAHVVETRGSGVTAAIEVGGEVRHRCVLRCATSVCKRG